jgi:hypothetical protein
MSVSSSSIPVAEQRACHFGAARGRDPDAGVQDLCVLDLEGDDLNAVARQLGAAARAELGGVQAVVSQDAVHLVGRVVARQAVVEDQDAPAGAAEHERGVETRGTRADDDAVPGGFGRRGHS